MKKVLVRVALISSVGLLVPLNVRAADETTTGNSGETRAQITFTAGSTNIKPVDPNKPSEPADPDLTTTNVTQHENSTGPSFIYVTPQMTFGDDQNQKINFYKGQTYFAKVSKDQVTTKAASDYDWNSQFVVEVADGRGAAANWNVKVMGDNLTGKDGATVTGATISWPLAVVHNSNHLDENGSASDLGSTVAKSVKMTLGDSAQSVLDVNQKNKGVGAGITTAQFDPSKITLDIPVNSVTPQTYSTKLSWTLSDEPTV